MLDDLYQAGTDAALNDLAARPLPQPTASPKFSVWNTIKAAPKGVAQGANESAGFWADVTGAFGQVAGATDARSSMFGSQTEAERQQEEQARQKLLKEGIDYTSPAGEDFRATAKDFMPDPTTAHTAEKVVGGLTRFITKAVGYSAAGGPVPGAALTGADEAFTTASDLKAKGVDLQTRTKVGAISGAAAAAGVLLPVSGSGVASTVALTAVGGPGMFVAQNAATREILQNAGYDKIGAQYDPFDPVGLAVSTLVPAGFGAWALRGAKLRAAGEIKPGEVKPGEVAPAAEHVAPEAARPTPEHVDAARVELLNQHTESTRLTPPEDIAGSNAHLTAVAQAIDQMGRGERVSVADILPPQSAQAARLADMVTTLQTAREGLLADAANMAEPGAIRQIRTELDTARADYVAATDAAEIKALAKQIQSTDQVSYKQALSNATKEMAQRADDAQARIDRLEGLVAQNAKAQRAFDALNQIDKQVADLQRQRSAIDAPATRETPVAAAAREAINTKAPTAHVQDATQPAAKPDATARAQTDAAAPEPATANARSTGAADGQSAAAADAGRTAAEPQAAGVGVGGDGAGAKAETAAHAARLAEIQAAFPDLEVMLDGMDKPAKLSEFLADIQRQAMEGTDMELGGNDAPLMQVAANCLLLNGG